MEIWNGICHDRGVSLFWIQIHISDTFEYFVSGNCSQLVLQRLQGSSRELDQDQRLLWHTEPTYCRGQDWLRYRGRKFGQRPGRLLIGCKHWHILISIMQYLDLWKSITRHKANALIHIYLQNFDPFEKLMFRTTCTNAGKQKAMLLLAYIQTLKTFQMWSRHLQAYNMVKSECIKNLNHNLTNLIMLRWWH